MKVTVWAFHPLKKIQSTGLNKLELISIKGTSIPFSLSEFPLAPDIITAAIRAQPLN